ncbi:hypothetical protein D3C80_1022970 [compost metagenome]
MIVHRPDHGEHPVGQGLSALLEIGGFQQPPEHVEKVVRSGLVLQVFPACRPFIARQAAGRIEPTLASSHKVFGSGCMMPNCSGVRQRGLEA